jgi:ApbE superfamily uncharacterized protein (UPF0280 family)
VYEPRIYRKDIENGRFRSFLVSYKETDLWIGVDRPSFVKNMEDFTLECVKRIRRTIEMYAEKDADFITSLIPYQIFDDGPPIVKRMGYYGRKAAVGPLASIAGTIAQEVGKMLEKEYDMNELVIENGGDIYMNIDEPTIVSVHAGDSSLSRRVGVKVLPQFSPLGICTSSGTVGHSLSFGRADAVVVACRETGLADAYATRYCNRIHDRADIKTILEEGTGEKEILYLMIIVNDVVGIKGSFGFEILKSETVDSP